MSRFFWICLGGSAGTGARYLLTLWTSRTLGPSFPYGTLSVNLLGSFLIGGLMHFGLAADMMSPTLRLALTTGVIGGFTTYSTFSYETLTLLREGAWWLAALNAAVTFFGCLAATGLGLFLARSLVPVAS